MSAYRMARVLVRGVPAGVLCRPMRDIHFSTAYGANESDYFIENNSNLMNVAISRAKDVFRVFGSIDCLQNGSSAFAKGLLYRYVQGNRF